MKTFVVAGTYHEANYWIINDLGKKYPTNTSLTMSHYVYVSKADDLRGVRDPHGVFVGNWLGRPDILEIVEALMMASVHVNPALGKIYKDVKSKVRPTPKLKPVSGGWINEQAAIDHAGMLMAQAIDAEVLRNLTRKINGGII
jgi:hypothetical protein